MKILKFIPLAIILTLLSSISFASECKECESLIKAKTGVKLIESWKCRAGKGNDGDSLGKKLKNIFKKKN